MYTTSTSGSHSLLPRPQDPGVRFLQFLQRVELELGPDSSTYYVYTLRPVTLSSQPSVKVSEGKAMTLGHTLNTVERAPESQTPDPKANTGSFP